MSDETPRLRLAQLVSLQELNAVTWNEALAQLDMLVDLCLNGQFVNTPPESPNDGDAYLIGGAPTGTWTGYAYKIAACLDGGWRFHTPFNGLRAFVVPSNKIVVYLNGTWTDIASTDFATKSGTETLSNKTLAATSLPGNGRLDASGNLGLGGTPADRFHAAGNGKITGSLALGGASVDTTIGLYYDHFYTDTSGIRYGALILPRFNPGGSATTTLYGVCLQASIRQDAANRTTGDFVGGSFLVNHCGGATQPGAKAGQFQVDVGYPGNGCANNLLTAGYAVFAAAPSVDAAHGSSLTAAYGVYVEAQKASGVGSGYGIYAAGANDVNYFAGVIGAGTASPLAGCAIDAAGHVLPHADNSYNLGSASQRFGTVYAATGTINTSGAQGKTGIRALSDAEIAVAMELAGYVCLFQFRDAVERKGESGARLHAGMIAEGVFDTFARHGLDPCRYGVCCRDPAFKLVSKTHGVVRSRPAGEDGTAYETVEENYETSEPDLDEYGVQKSVLGLRYGELTQFVLAGLAARLARLEAN